VFVAPASMADFDAMPVTDAAAELLPCCASRRWINELVNRRPYGSLDALTAASDAVLAGLSWADVEEALAAHPRIGERSIGERTLEQRREEAWSRQEQSGVRPADGEIEVALREGNVAYEEHFGHVFLINATGLSGGQMLAALRARLGNPPDTERAVVRTELIKIVRLRLAKALR
jgi:2-oxo-4-hydroxy-4-carboxy-5-ureidoimidazoline decarboxylase